MLDRRQLRALALVPILAVAALFAQRSATAQQPRQLTLDSLYHPEKKAEFSVPRATLAWLDDDYYVAQGGRMPGSSGRKPWWYFSWPVAVSVASVRPWNEPWVARIS